MYNATDKPKGLTPFVTGSPAQGKGQPDGTGNAPLSSVKPPAIKNRPVTVPPLKLDKPEKKSVIASPDHSPPSSPPRSPIRLTSPAKVLRSISEKASTVKVRVEHAVSPRLNLAETFEGIEWTDFDQAPISERAPSPGSPSNRKRKAETDANTGQAKKVRFDAQPTISRDQSSSSVATIGKVQIDELMKNLSKPMGPPPRPLTAPPTGFPLLETGLCTPSPRKRPTAPQPELLMNGRERRALNVAPLPATSLTGMVSGTAKATATTTTAPVLTLAPTVAPAISTPTRATPRDNRVADLSVLLKPSLELAESLEKELDAHDAIHREALRVREKPDEAPSADSFPFAPDKLGKWAIKQREKGREWVGKATGDSIAGTLQRTLDTLREDNADRIDPKACDYLQELFGLLPAGVSRQGKALNYMLMKSFYSLGLTHAQWHAIEQLHQQFDQLDTRRDPQSFKAFKQQLDEIVAAKKGLMYLKQQAAQKDNEVRS